MTLRTFFTGGQTSGDSITNTGGISTVAVGTNGGTAKYSTSGTLRRSGVAVAEFIRGTGTTDQALARLTFATTTSASMRCRIPFQIPDSQDSLAEELASFRHPSGKLISLMRGNAGTVYLLDQGGTQIGATMLTAAQATAGTWFDLAIEATSAAGSTGTVTAQIYTTAAATIGTAVSVTTAKTSDGSGAATTWAAVDVGVVSSNNTAGAKVRIADAQLEDTSGSRLAAYSPGGAAPTVTAGSPVTITAAGSVTASFTSTPSSGNTIASRAYSWEVLPAGVTAPTLSNTSGDSPSATIPTPGYYVLKMVPTDSAGQAATTPAYFEIFYADSTAKVIAVVANAGAWTNDGGAASLIAALSDASLTTQALSPNNPASEATIRLSLAPLKSAQVTGFTLTLSHILRAAGSGVAKVRFLEGSGGYGATTYTQRKEWTLSPTTSQATNDPYSMTSAECATVGSWNKPAVELSWA